MNIYLQFRSAQREDAFEFCSGFLYSKVGEKKEAMIAKLSYFLLILHCRTRFKFPLFV